jgi:hypothetical protein
MDPYHWIQIALSLARRAGLNRDPSSMNMPEDEKRLRRRLWWCLMIRDPLCSLGMKRPISVLAADHDVPELTLHDWNPANISHDGLSAFNLSWNHHKILLLRMTCVAEAELHQCLREIMSKQYVLGDYHRGRPIVDPKVTRAILLPITTDDSWRTLSECEGSLRSWQENLPPEVSYSPIASDSPDSIFDAFTVFRSVLHMAYRKSSL